MQITNDQMSIMHKIAWDMHVLFPGFDADDLFGEACLAFVQRIDRYDPEKGAMSTFLYKVVKNRLLDYISTNRNGHIHAHVDYVDARMPDKSIMFRAKIREMNRPAKELCEMILNAPEFYASMDLQLLTKHLRKIGWSWKQIRDTFKDVKERL